MKTLDYLAHAVQRVLRGEKDGIYHIWYRWMSDIDRLKFDGFLVTHDDPLAYEAGTPFSRFQQKVNRMVELEKERRDKQPPMADSLDPLDGEDQD